MQKRYVWGLITAFILSGVSGSDADDAFVNRGRLIPCPDSPNCVSTESDRKGQTMDPLPYLQTREESREKILSILKGMKRTKIITSAESYIQAECRTALWGFVDDVAFFFDDTARLVHFRSASRTGYYDFGQNRRRMKEISEKYVKKGL